MGSREIEKLRKHTYQGRAEDQRTKATALVAVLQEKVAKLAKKKTAALGSFRRAWETLTGKDAPLDLLPQPDATTRQKARFCLEGAFVAALLDAGYNSWVAPDVLNFERWVAVSVGMVVGVIIAILTTAALNTRFRETEPTSSLDRLKSFTGGFVTSSVVSLAALLALRFYPVPHVLNTILVVLGVTLPISAGSLFFLARKVDELNRQADEWSEVDDDLRAAEYFLKELEDFIDTSEEETSKSPSLQPATTDAGKLTPLVAPALVLICVLVLAGRVSAAPSSSTAQVKFFPDQSGSLSVAEYGRVLRVLGKLDAPLRGPWKDVRRVQILPWSSALDAWTNGGDNFDLPPPPRRELINPGKKPKQLFKVAALAEASEMEQANNDANILAAAEYDRSVRATVRRIAASLRAIDPARQSTQTCVYDVVLRALLERENTVSVIVSDAEPWACGKPRTPATTGITPSTNSQVYFLLVPSRKDKDDVLPNMQRRMERLRHDFPNVRVVRSFEVDDSWSWLK